MVIAMSSIALAAEDPVQPSAPRNNVSPSCIDLTLSVNHCCISCFLPPVFFLPSPEDETWHVEIDKSPTIQSGEAILLSKLHKVHLRPNLNVSGC